MKSLSSILELLSTSTTVFSLLDAIDFHLKGPFLVLVWIDVLWRCRWRRSGGVTQQDVGCWMASSLWWWWCSLRSQHTGTSPETPAPHDQSTWWWRSLCAGGGGGTQGEASTTSCTHSKLLNVQHIRIKPTHCIITTMLWTLMVWRVQKSLKNKSRRGKSCLAKCCEIVSYNSYIMIKVYVRWVLRRCSPSFVCVSCSGKTEAMAEAAGVSHMMFM